MQNLKFLIILLIILISFSALGQKVGKSANTEKILLKETFEDGLFFYELEDYKEALYSFQKILEKMPDNANIQFWVGHCYVNLPGEETKAIPYLEFARKRISLKYKKDHFEEKNAPLYLLFDLGNAYRINNEIDKALECYNTFRNHPTFEGTYNAGMVENEIAACERAKLIQDNPINIKTISLGQIINNANSNRRPVVTPDESVLVYLSGLKFYDAIFISRKINGEWSEPENISGQVESDGDCEPTCISADGKELYFIKKQKGNYDIYVSKFENGLWTTMKALNKNINSSKMETGASLTSDGRFLYFSSDRRGGEGKLDIYYSEKLANGDWGPAKNLGKTINTDQNENMPVICEDGKTLYFISEGNLSMGGYDIFISTLLANGKWDISANIGYPANSTGNDLYWYPIKNGEIVYSSLIKPNGFGQEDIYRIENITAVSRNASSGNTQLFKVYVKSKINNEVIGALLYDKNPDSLNLKKSSSDYIEIKLKN